MTDDLDALRRERAEKEAAEREQDKYVDDLKAAERELAEAKAALSAKEREAKAAREYLSSNCGKIIVAMDSGSLSLAKHLLVTAMAFPEPGEGGDGEQSNHDHPGIIKL